MPLDGFRIVFDDARHREIGVEFLDFDSYLVTDGRVRYYNDVSTFDSSDSVSLIANIFYLDDPAIPLRNGRIPTRFLFSDRSGRRFGAVFGWEKCNAIVFSRCQVTLFEFPLRDLDTICAVIGANFCGKQTEQIFWYFHGLYPLRGQ